MMALRLAENDFQMIIKKVNKNPLNHDQKSLKRENNLKKISF